MMVTFISQCEKKALNKTRRVLDAFANRIGSNTWQTVITEQGLQAVKKLLRKTATKNTAVSCHWIRSRSRSEFIWSVGSNDKFNSEGIVPVNYTQQNISQYMDKTNWKIIEVIKYAASIAGLFHDFGKANKLFQDKLNPEKSGKNYEPYRHEWLSLRLFQAFVGNNSDLQWLEALVEVDKESITTYFRDGIDKADDIHAFNNLPPLAKLVAWLILTHHRLPLSPTWLDGQDAPPLDDIDNWITEDFAALWNSYNCKNEEMKSLLIRNWVLKALPTHSKQWVSHASILASKSITGLKSFIGKDIDWLNEQVFTTHLARLSLIMADHYYSGEEKVTEQWRNTNYEVYANTYRDKTKDNYKQYKQQLDEHLIGVAHHAGEIAKALPKLNATLESLEAGKSEFTDNVPKEHKENFGWQDEAKRIALELSKASIEQGFFGINMASTGKGKTLANAKIMYALGNKTGRRRFSVAVGLRTLTLQTGKEFQKNLKLNDEKLAIAVGGSSVKQLFENTNKKHSEAERSGSESAEDLIDQDMYVHYKGGYKKHSLSYWTKPKKESDKQKKQLEHLLQAPVLVSTIDHLIPATEGTRSGKQIAPMLRLLTSDLVLDEPDDFGLNDLPALCRLIHWAGMLGSRVLLSTATMPPHLAYALFEAYKKGWSEYAKANIDNWKGDIVCAWFDDNKNSCTDETINSTADFKEYHSNFIKKRVAYLKQDNRNSVRKGKIINVDNNKDKTVYQNYANTVYKNILKVHKNHQQTNSQNPNQGKTISIGLVRMANINPLVAVAKELLKIKVEEPDTCIHYCIYHSRYPLAIRSEIEEQLDDILCRKNPEKIWAKLESCLSKYEQKNHIFVVIASPVAEVGRDHDYDWAIVEPSSMRSIIQLAGRILRHRNIKDRLEANILILNKNIKAIKKKELAEICFEKPGFESKLLKMETYDLNEILTKDQFEVINAIPRITMAEHSEATEHTNLVELEHAALKKRLMGDINGAKYWWESKPHWCGEVQRQQRFRQSTKDEAYYLMLKDEDTKTHWEWKNENCYPVEFSPELNNISIDDEPTIKLGDHSYFWFDLNANNIYMKLSTDFEIELLDVSKRFGEVRIIDYKTNKIKAYNYHECLGLYQELGE